MDPSILGPLDSNHVVLNQANEATSQLSSSLNQLVQAVSESHLSNDATSSSASLPTENVNRTIYRIPKESLIYYYCIHYSTPLGQESHYYKLAFPILRGPNKCYLNAYLEVETSEPRPSNAQLLINIRNAIEVYKRVAGQKELIKEECSISTIFKHPKRDALKIDLMGDIIPLEKGYRVPLHIEFSFGAKIRSSVDKTFRTIKLFDIPLLEDILTEKETSNRDQKIAGTQAFRKWERQVPWYPQYAKMLGEKRPIATRVSLEEVELSSNKNNAMENLGHPEEQEETSQQPTLPPTRERNRSIVGPLEEPPAKRSRSIASPSISPTRDSSDHPSLSSTMEKVEQVAHLARQVLQYLATVEEQGRQISQLKKELQQAKSENQDLLDAWEKESQGLHQEIDQHKASAQTAQETLNRFKAMAQPMLQLLSTD